ncbi:MAG: hypothetical protein JW745_03025 [Sedimentisphaerales bacterium]|nr:hypothetical protein [Sedimentisphaerales bacterium]MBN2843033.1 hypothetical protein [Sedimentisphaerales bacterium]
MKKSTLIKRFFLVGFIVIVLGLFLIISWLDSLGRIAVEKGGSAALGVPVTMDKLHISFIHGEVKLDNLQVGNPQGFNTEYLFKLGHCGTAVDIASLTSETIEVKSVVVKDMEITFEQKGMTSNLQALLDSLESQAPAQEPEEPVEPVEPETPAGEEKPAKKITLHRFYIEGAKVHVKLLPIPGQKSDFTIGMAPFTIENISSDDNKGQVAALVVRKLVVAISQSVLKTIASDIPAALIEGLQNSVDKTAELLGSGTKELLKGLTTVGDVGLKGAGEVIKGGAQAVEATGEGLKAVGEGTVDALEQTGKGLEKGVKDLGKGIEDAGKGITDLFKKKEDKSTEQ